MKDTKIKLSRAAKLLEALTQIHEEENIFDGMTEATITIDKVILANREGSDDDRKMLKCGQELSYEEAQDLLFAADYEFNARPDSLGYDKVNVEVFFHIDGAEDKKDTARLRIDIGDGKFGADALDILAFVKKIIEEHCPNLKLSISNQPVAYNKEAYEAKYGTKAEHVKKFLAEHPLVLPTDIDYNRKTPEEIAIGDIYVDSEHSDYTGKNYYAFYKVVKRTKAQVTLKPIGANIIKGYQADKNDNVEEVCYYVPNEAKEPATRNFGMNFDKPFRIKQGYSGGIMLVQGSGYDSVYVRPWSGKALQESLETPKSELSSLAESLNNVLESLAPFKLTTEEKEHLLADGHSEDDLVQIQKAANAYKTTYEIDGRRINRDEAIALLGRENFISGLARSAFHWTAARDTLNGETITFDSGKLHEGEVISFTDYKNAKEGVNTDEPKLAVNGEEPPKPEEQVEDKPKLKPAEAKDYTENGTKKPNDVAVGDILYSSWGYGMTNVDYYRVIDRTKASFRLEKLDVIREADNDDSGRVIPADVNVPDKEVDGKIFRIGKYVVGKLSPYQRLYYWNGKPHTYTSFD